MPTAIKLLLVYTICIAIAVAIGLAITSFI